MPSRGCLDGFHVELHKAEPDEESRCRLGQVCNASVPEVAEMIAPVDSRPGTEVFGLTPTHVESHILLPAGTPAPDFRLPTTPEQEVGLSDFRGRPVILAFYPADWSPVCSDQMVLYQEVMPLFQGFDAILLGISCDGVWCHLAFAKERKLRFPLLSDFHPKGDVSRAYNAYREEDGYSERALAVIDGDGAVRWSHLSPVGVNPGADGILRALEKMAAEDGPR